MIIFSFVRNAGQTTKMLLWALFLGVLRLTLYLGCRATSADCLILVATSAGIGLLMVFGTIFTHEAGRHRLAGLLKKLAALFFGVMLYVVLLAMISRGCALWHTLCS